MDSWTIDKHRRWSSRRALGLRNLNRVDSIFRFRTLEGRSAHGANESTVTVYCWK